MLPSRQVLEKILEWREARGTDAALAYLGEELDRRAALPGRYGGLYVDVWREAQVRSGRMDPDWAVNSENRLMP